MISRSAAPPSKPAPLVCGTGETTMGWVGGVLLVPTPSMWGPGRPSLAGRGTNFLVELLVGGVRSAGWQRSKMQLRWCDPGAGVQIRGHMRRQNTCSDPAPSVD